MRSLNKLLLMGSTIGLCFGGSTAYAQTGPSDTNPTLPNILLVVDTSGSMQLTLDNTAVTDKCHQNKIRSRWSLVIEALTGSLPTLDCNSSGYVGSFYGPGAGDDCFPDQNPFAGGSPNPWDWWNDGTKPLEARDAVCFVDQQPPGKCCKIGPGGWQQNNDGAIDLFGDRIRFALMTSDLGTHADIDNKDYHTSGPPPFRERWRIQPSFAYIDPTPASAGGYSYWWNGGGNWTTGSGSAIGNYFNATNSGTADKPWEVGVRNRNAAPWEGRMMGFGNSGVPVAELKQQNDRIQQVLLASHPALTGSVGAFHPGDLSPFTAMVSDAQDFLMSDTDFLPNYPTAASPNFNMGLQGDAAKLCRNTDVVFITSGPFGLDMLNSKTDGYVRKPTDWRTFTTTVNPFPLPPTITQNVLMSCADGATCPYAAAGVWGSTDLAALKTSLSTAGGGAVHVLGVTKHTAVAYAGASCQFPATLTGGHCELNCEDLSTAAVTDPVTQYPGLGAPSPPGVAPDQAYACAANIDPVTHAPVWLNDGTAGEAAGILAACCELSYLSYSLGEPAVFIDDQSQLKQALSNIATRASGRTTSRVMPAFAAAAPTIDQPNAPGTNSNPTEPGPGGPVVDPASFELNGGLIAVPTTGVIASSKIDMWRGRLERRRYTCDTTATPVAANINPAVGDDFGENILTGWATRQFFTVVGQETFGGNEPNVVRSMRLDQSDYDASLGLTDPNTAAGDKLGAISVKLLSNQTLLDTSDQLGPKILAKLTGGKKTEDVLGIDNKDKSKCSSEFGNANKNPPQCADRTLEWFGGYQHGGAAFVAGVQSPFRNDRCPDTPADTRCTWVDPDNINAHPLGAVYHSQPVLVGPPLDFLNDEAYRKSFAPVASVTAPNGQGERPTVLYSQTIDGMLHAFVVAKNSGSTGPYATVPAPNTDGLNELWSFIPPILLPQIWANFNSHAILLDGPMAVGDTIVKRDFSTAQGGLGIWKTILVGSGGASSAGGFYYAVDVTDPIVHGGVGGPKFLWQLSTAGDNQGSTNGPVPMFGPSVPGAAVTTVSVKNGTHEDQVGIAILAGGNAGFAPPTYDKSGNPITVPRRCGGCVHAGVRGTIRDWGNSVAARSVTIVELGTGKVLKRFEGVIGDNTTPGDLPTNDSGNVLPGVRDASHALDSPMTGTPVVFPNSPGVAANRAYVGDADGTMWRIDLSDRDPNNWKIDIAWDAYPSDAVGLAGQPVEIPPVLSTNLTGVPVVIYATGSQDGFSQYSAGLDNELVAFLDTPSGTGGSFAPALLFPQQAFPNGERVTGPMTLFNQVIYFATFVPAATGGVCTGAGEAFIWGLDFLTGGNGLDVSPVDGNPDSKKVGIVDGGGNPTGSVIFGVQLSRVPSCFGGGGTTNSDGWMAGNYKSETTASKGSYELVFNTGIASAGSSTQFGADAIVGASGAQTGNTNTLHVKTAAPKALVRLHSWASVSE